MFHCSCYFSHGLYSAHFNEQQKLLLYLDLRWIMRHRGLQDILFVQFHSDSREFDVSESDNECLAVKEKISTGQ